MRKSQSCDALRKEFSRPPYVTKADVTESGKAGRWDRALGNFVKYEKKFGFYSNTIRSH